MHHPNSDNADQRIGQHWILHLHTGAVIGRHCHSNKISARFANST